MIRIDYTKKGVPYFRFSGRRWRLDDFIRADYCTGDPDNCPRVKDRAGNEVIVHALHAVDAFHAVGVHIDSGGDGLRAFWMGGDDK